MVSTTEGPSNLPRERTTVRLRRILHGAMQKRHCSLIAQFLEDIRNQRFEDLHVEIRTLSPRSRFRANHRRIPFTRANRCAKRKRSFILVLCNCCERRDG
jgi:hypothetical protein